MHLSCRLAPSLAARCTAPQLEAYLTLHLPRAQGFAHQLVRQRGGGCELRLHLRWRESLSLLEAWQAGRQAELPECWQDALHEALAMSKAAEEEADAAARFACIYLSLCRRLKYANTAPGRVGYESLVGAAGALLGGVANCQGFSDACCLIGRLAGLDVRHVIGCRWRALHMWNAVRTENGWLYADVSRGARLMLAGEDPSATLLKTAEEMRRMGFSWEAEEDPGPYS